MNKIVYDDVKVLFFDVGNTLISIDFVWVSEELSKRGIQCDAKTLQRAEASARPEISTQINSVKNNPSIDERAFYFTKILNNIPSATKKGTDSINHIVQDLIEIFFSEGNAIRLWSYVLPGTYEALGILQAMGYQMHVISNADGSIEQQLIEGNLRSFFNVVIDSYVVKVEKPNPKIFEIALEKANCKPKESLYIGDIYDIDIVGANSVGMQAVLIDPFFDWNDVDCECVSDLLTLAGKLQSIKGKD